MFNFFHNIKLYILYPFLIPRNRWDESICWSQFGKTSELDEIPEGWRKAFGLKLCKELKEAIKRDKKSIWGFRFGDIKEKWGLLCIYCTHGNNIDKVIRKYEEISRFVCIECGKKATEQTISWISSYCKKCVKDKSEPLKGDCSYNIDEYCIKE